MPLACLSGGASDESPEEQGVTVGQSAAEPTEAPATPVGLVEPAVTRSEDPIAFIGHGAMFDRAGNRIEATPELIESVQDLYLDAVLARADEAQRADFEARQKRVLGDRSWDQGSALYARSVLLESLLDEVGPPDAARLAGHSRLMRLTTAFEVPQELRRVLDAEGLDRSHAVAAQAGAPLATTQSGAAYIAECAANGVPIPPDWGSSQWVSRGVLTEDFIGATGSVGEVFTYQSSSPAGVCFALPRSIGNSIKLLGIICLGKASSKACFWDNQKDDWNYAIPKGTYVPLSEFAGGAELEGGSGGECTGCHAGENPFIIHPNTPLGLPNLNGLPLQGNDWYKPLVAASWAQNPGPETLIDGVPSAKQCTSCHSKTGGGGRFPKVSQALDGYCGVLQQAFQRTMPPGNPGSADYQNHFEALTELCDTPAFISPRAPQKAAVNVVSRSANKLDVFVTDEWGVTYTAAWEPSFVRWHGWWEILGGRAQPGSPIHAVSRSQDKLDIFVVGTDQLIATAGWQPSFPDGWHGWWDINGGAVALGAPVTAVSQTTDRIDTFAVGLDGHVYTAHWKPGFTSWQGWFKIGNISVPQGSAVHAVSRDQNRIDIFATDVNGHVWTAYGDPWGWHQWNQVLGGQAHPGAPVTAVSRSKNKIDIFVVGLDGRTWSAAWEPSAGWRGWWPIGSAIFPPRAPIHAVSRSTDKLDIFGSDVNGNVVTAAWQPAHTDGWHGWWTIKDGKIAPGGPVTAVARAPDQLDIFAVGLDGRVWSAAWHPSYTDGWQGWWPLGD